MKVYQQAESQDAAALYELCRATPGVVYRGSLSQPRVGRGNEGGGRAQLSEHVRRDQLHCGHGGPGGRGPRVQRPGALPETTLGLGTLVPDDQPAIRRRAV